MATSFSALIQSEKPVLVDFFATWCGPCKTMSPVIQELKRDLGDAITIIKVDVDRQPALAHQYQIQGVPTFMLFKKSELLWRQSGVLSKAHLKQLVQPHL